MTVDGANERGDGSGVERNGEAYVTADAVQTRADLSRALTVLRVRGGFTVRELSKRLDVPAATLGGYFSGRHLPGPAYLGVYRGLLEACGVAADEVEPWVDALTRARLTSDGRVSLPSAPYRGLEPFEAEDASLFCGRERVTEEVLRALAKLAGDPDAPIRLLMVVGPSGSGKSSILRAGVVPALRSGALDDEDERWTVEVMAPGPEPLRELERCLSGGEGTHRVVVVDQLEEVFNLDPGRREELFERLGGLGPGEGAVVGVLRADFYEAAVMQPLLLPALRHNQVLVGPMTEDEVRQAIVRPAQQLGVEVDDGLVEVLLSDLAPRQPTGYAHEPGSLPLLSHALLATWERSQRNHVTVAAYRAAGGVRGAVAQSAEELYLALDAGQQALARRIFLGLVNVDDDAHVTRRIMTPADADELGEDAVGVLARFVGARLLTGDASGIQVSHEALLTAWPRLSDWLEADRASLRIQRDLARAATEWEAAGQEPSLLLRGSRLALALEWATAPDRSDEVGRSGREYLAASEALQSAELVAARRSARRTRRLLALVAAFALVTSVLAGLALDAESTATAARNQALSRQVAIEASQLEATDPALAMQLALTAYDISPTLQARSVLIDASAGEMPTRIVGPPGPTALALGGRGRLLAVAASATDEVELYSLGSARPRLLGSTRVAASNAQTYAVALSPNGRLLAAAGTDGAVSLYDVSDPHHARPVVRLTGFRSTVYDAAFSPDGTTLAAASNDGTVRIWDVAGSRPALESVVRAPGGASLQAVAFSPDGRLIAAAGAGGTLLVWRLGQRTAGVVRGVRGAGSAELTSLAFSPDGRTLCTGGQDDVVRVFSVAPSGAVRAAHAPLGGFTSYVDSLAFSPGGTELVAGSSDDSLHVWSTAGWTSAAVLEHTAPVTGAAFLPSGHTLVTADAGGTVRLWSMPPPATYLTSGPVYDVDYTTDGSRLAAVTGGALGDVSLWNVSDPWLPVHTGNVAVAGGFGPVAAVGAMSLDGRLLAVGDGAAHIRLVQLAKSGRPRAVGPTLTGATPTLEQIVLDNQGNVLASGDNAGRVHLWEVSDPAHPRALSVLSQSGYVVGVAFSPNGKLLAAATTADKVWLWDVSDPAQPRRLAVVGGFASYAYCVTFTPNGRTLIAGSADDTVRMWDLSDPARPRLLGRPLTGPTSYVYALSVSPDGEYLAAGTVSGAVWLWDIADPAHPSAFAELDAAQGSVYDVTFSPNGETLAAGGSDQALTFWDYRPAQVAARVCALTVSRITRAEWSEYVQGARYAPPCR
ncbi:MAG TPA: helix-turn-helix domain-containing protein [Acidimicrobiales bacterium]|nr:helix-turn-helix domain-containing protein [Acidimicrobiales bacterium]